MFWQRLCPGSTVKAKVPVMLSLYRMREGSCFILHHCSYLVLLETSLEEAFFSLPMFVSEILVNNCEAIAVGLFLGCIFCTHLYDFLFKYYAGFGTRAM